MLSNIVDRSLSRNKTKSSAKYFYDRTAPADAAGAHGLRYDCAGLQIER